MSDKDKDAGTAASIVIDLVRMARNGAKSAEQCDWLRQEIESVLADARKQGRRKNRKKVGSK